MGGVSPSELRFLSVARALVGALPATAVRSLLVGKELAPKMLSPTAARSFETTLARGAVLALGRGGGWRTGRFLHDGEVLEGRLWERRSLAPLSFSTVTFDLLCWLVRAPLGHPDCAPFEQAPRESGDELAMFLAVRLGMSTHCKDVMARSAGLRSSPLCWLAYPDVLGGPATATPGPPNEETLTQMLTTDRAFLVEALQGDLAGRWFEIEVGKGSMGDQRTLVALGNTQEAVMEHLVVAARRAGRPDLLGFLLEAAGRVLAPRPSPWAWVRGLTGSSGHPLGVHERTLAYRAASAFLRGLDQLHTGVEQARQVRFFEEDYGRAQLILAQWARVGQAGYGHARSVVADLESLDAPTRFQTQGAR